MKKTRALLLSLLIVILLMSLLPIQAAQAQEATTSDLSLRLVSIPKHAKACQTFEATYTVTNLGPDPVHHLSGGAGIPDAYDVVDIVGLPESLAMGESATFTIIIKVTAFVPGEIRHAWVNAGVISDYYLEPSIDPNPDNNMVYTEMKVIGKRSTESCPR
jgi:hypothetical protein